ncbi:DNA polymerase epsilon subunit B [Ancylostoma duodenale]|uniref:DNA polymerase II subunit 2 n=1 Tax=Ancylostoma duodenale TaxID=51022 RepID=A0A0C2C9V2_9BILA|nr:DNA polymerase epsilon subunit B [Ancylostoma duodenale]
MEDVERTRVRREISSSFRINAFEPKKEVLDTCVEALCKFDKEKRKKWLNKIIETLRKQSLSSSVVTQDVIREVFAQISNRATKQNNSLFNVFDAFSIRRYIFDADCRKMLPVEEAPKVVSTVDKATEAIRHRFQLVAQRISRCRQLQAIKFNTIESLLGSSRRQNDVVVVGMLTQQKGSYDASLLTVREVASVPLESAEETRATFGNVNWFGGEDPIAFRCNTKLCVAERTNPNAQIVILSDVHLDNSRVMQAVYHMLSGFSGDPPLAFIFCGNFCSRPRQRETMELLHTGFRRLANQLNEFASSFTSTHFIFVPGPDDPCLNMVGYSVIESIQINDVVFRHAVNTVAAENIPKSFAKTILSQVCCDSPIVYAYL